MSQPSEPSSAPSDDQTPIFFWKETEQPHGFLCQWYPSRFTSPAHPNITFNCAEQYMMYQKAITAKDPEIAQRILATEKPGEQKWFAKKLETLDMKMWHKVKFEIVVEGNVCKFHCNQDLKEKLLATGERELVEASPSDRRWGIGFAAEYAEATREKWGQNLLGKALMTVRARLQAEQTEV
ncbi:MAG: hypothetical protein Q9209_004474 [Squamulea sp. 1 TL-2023]